MFEKDILKNKVVLITGGGTGLGKSMAMRFAELGASLVIASRRKEVISEAASQMKEIGAEVLGLQCDVRDTDQVNSMVSDTLNQFDKIDILINNAAGNLFHRQKCYHQEDSKQLLILFLWEHLTVHLLWVKR